jgi:hypothetical protein
MEDLVNRNNGLVHLSIVPIMRISCHENVPGYRLYSSVLIGKKAKKFCTASDVSKKEMELHTQNHLLSCLPFL